MIASAIDLIISAIALTVAIIASASDDTTEAMLSNNTLPNQIRIV